MSARSGVKELTRLNLISLDAALCRGGLVHLCRRQHKKGKLDTTDDHVVPRRFLTESTFDKLMNEEITKFSEFAEYQLDNLGLVIVTNVENAELASLWSKKLSTDDNPFSHWKDAYDELGITLLDETLFKNKPYSSYPKILSDLGYIDKIVSYKETDEKKKIRNIVEYLTKDWNADILLSLETDVPLFVRGLRKIGTIIAGAVLNKKGSGELHTSLEEDVPVTTYFDKFNKSCKDCNKYTRFYTPFCVSCNSVEFDYIEHLPEKDSQGINVIFEPRNKKECHTNRKLSLEVQNFGKTLLKGRLDLNKNRSDFIIDEFNSNSESLGQERKKDARIFNL